MFLVRFIMNLPATNETKRKNPNSLLLVTRGKRFLKFFFIVFIRSSPDIR